MDPSLVMLGWIALLIGVAFSFRTYTLKQFLNETFGVPWYGLSAFDKRLRYAQSIGLDVSEIKQQRDEKKLEQLLTGKARHLIHGAEDAIRRLPKRLPKNDHTLSDGVKEARELIKVAKAAIKQDPIRAVKNAREAQHVLEGAAIDYHVEQG